MRTAIKNTFVPCFTKLSQMLCFSTKSSIKLEHLSRSISFYSFIRSFVRSFVCSFVRSFVLSFVRSCVRACVR